MKASVAGQVEHVKVLLHGGVQVNVQNEVSAVPIKLQVTRLYLVRCTQALQPMSKRINSNNLITHGYNHQSYFNTRTFQVVITYVYRNTS